MDVGQDVKWTSTSNGSKVAKVGRIEAVVGAGQHVSSALSLSAAKNDFALRTDYAGSPRDHVSYLVSVPGKTSNSKRLLYWPRVSGLELVDEASE